MENEKKNLLIGCACLVFDGMRSKKQVKTPTSSEQKAIQAKAEQLQKDNKSILQKAEENQSSYKNLCFPKDDKGTQQTQIVTYVGNTFKNWKLSM